jgi:hypothetical protein
VVRRALVSLALIAVLAGCGGPARRQTASQPQLVDPHAAAVAFAGCMRAHGVPHPDPDSAGNFQLTPAQERRMKGSTPKQHERAERACFHFLKPVVSTKPLSPQAMARARRALTAFSGCMAARGYDYFRSAPVVRNLSRGRAFFGFELADPRAAPLQKNPRFLRARTACERVLNGKLNAIIATDRHDPQY